MTQEIWVLSISGNKIYNEVGKLLPKIKKVIFMWKERKQVTGAAHPKIQSSGKITIEIGYRVFEGGLSVIWFIFFSELVYMF